MKAAKKLFEKEGFDCVTIEKLAKLSAVSVPTIYVIFKSKRGVLRALFDEALSPNKFWALVDETRKEKLPQKRLSISAKIARQIYDAERQLIKMSPNVSIIAPELKELEKEKEKRRYARQRDSIETMVEEKSLMKGLSFAQARDIFWALTGRDVYRMLVIERGWTSDQYEKWLSQMLVNALLDSNF